ncbi:serine hydrolase domain-containing protein [Jidongwangia harbinensis]|uniref:serine hydrolase domain-containing protein n=1 Tax=Jidongwangia harbinensis TaxID=2878561 RepID=UPI001CDA2D70|nr:serine hydrolase [Jidongwangia harbinensis]MCA2217506.1 beta-lactamase family protein [Jidongwangia harbinensis]
MSVHAVEGFIAAWEEMALAGRSEPHSFMMLRHGTVVAEAWWHPYRADASQNLYSVSKTFATLAIGFAVAEGTVRIDDPVISFFPNLLPETVSPNLAAMRVQHLLTMTTGHPDNMTWPMMMRPDWTAAFLALPVPDAPGSRFVYNSAATYMLSAIIQSVSGSKLVDYLEPRLFTPLGARGQRWAESPEGVNTGGWGLSAPTETLAKTGQLFLERGMVDGVQLLPAEWMDQASAFQVQQPADWDFAGMPAPDANLDHLRLTSDYYQGYGYQVWRGRNDSYRADGALAQFMIVVPALDAVIALTSESPDWQGLLDLIWEKLLPAFDGDGNTRPGSVRTTREELPRPTGSTTSPLIAGVGGAEFTLEPNVLEAERLTVTFDGEEAHFRMVRSTGDTVLRGSAAQWLDGTTNMPGTPPDLFSDPTSAVESPVSTAVAWPDDNTLVFRARFYETPHADTLTCTFHGDTIEVRFLNSCVTALGATDDAHPLAERRPLLRGVRR